MACKNKNNNLPVGNLFRRVYEWEHGTWEVGEGDTLPAPSDLFAYFIAMACNHCENPAMCGGMPFGRHAEKIRTPADRSRCASAADSCAGLPYHAPSFRGGLHG